MKKKATYTAELFFNSIANETTSSYALSIYRQLSIQEMNNVIFHLGFLEKAKQKLYFSCIYYSLETIRNKA